VNGTLWVLSYRHKDFRVKGCLKSFIVLDLRVVMGIKQKDLRFFSGTVSSRPTPSSLPFGGMKKGRYV